MFKSLFFIRINESRLQLLSLLTIFMLYLEAPMKESLVHTSSSGISPYGFKLRHKFSSVSLILN